MLDPIINSTSMSTRTRLVAMALAISVPAITLPRERPAGDDLLSAYIAVWNGGDLEQLRSLVTPDFRRHGGPDESCSSVADLEELISGARRVWKRLLITVEDSMSAPDGGAIRGLFYGVHRRTNGIIEFPTMSIFRFEEGRIAEEWVIGDNFLPLMALGYELVPPGFEIVPPSGKDPAQPGQSSPGTSDEPPPREQSR
jgi:hypothetical protein